MNIVVTIFKSIMTSIITTIVLVSAAAIVYVIEFSNFMDYKLFQVYLLLLESTSSRASV